MGRELTYLVMAAFLLGCGGCGRKADEVRTETPAAVPGAKAVDSAAAGVLRGKVVFEGAAPAPRELAVKGNPECAVFHPGGKILSEELAVKDGALRNVFVYVKSGLEGYSFPPPSKPVTISNRQCVYVPHVAGVQAGQPVILLNEDPTLHNVHAYSKNSKPFNLGLPFQGMKQTEKFDAPEIMVALKCDVHPWMSGYIGVLPHPYFGVSDEEGAFEIKNLPPGELVIEAWHEKLGAQSQTVRIGPRETKEIEFTFRV